MFKGHLFEEDKLTRGKEKEREKVLLYNMFSSLPLSLCPSVRKGSACRQCCATWNLKINFNIAAKQSCIDYHRYLACGQIH